MTATQITSDLIATVQSVIDSTVAPSAIDIDRSATFPRRNVEALGQAGAHGVLSSAEVGGADL